MHASIHLRTLVDLGLVGQARPSTPQPCRLRLLAIENAKRVTYYERHLIRAPDASLRNTSSGRGYKSGKKFYREIVGPVEIV
jgi:hypothetical protein